MPEIYVIPDDILEFDKEKIREMSRNAIRNKAIIERCRELLPGRNRRAVYRQLSQEFGLSVRWVELIATGEREMPKPYKKKNT